MIKNPAAPHFSYLHSNFGVSRVPNYVVMGVFKSGTKMSRSSKWWYFDEDDNIFDLTNVLNTKDKAQMGQGIVKDMWRNNTKRRGKGRRVKTVYKNQENIMAQI